MTSYVLDASAALRLHLADGPMPEGLLAAAECVDGGAARFVAPELFWVEVAHVLMRGKKAGALKPRDFRDTWENLLSGSVHTFRHLEYLDDAMQLADDYDHLAMVRGLYPVPRAPLDLFRFVGSEPQERHALMEAGRLPWWTDAQIHLAVLRPLSSLLLQLDFVLFGVSPLGPHLHSLLWWASMVVAVALVFRSVLPLSVAALATLLFVFEEGHSLPLVWVASRSAFVAGGLMLWAFYFHIRWRRGGDRVGRWLSPLLAALALAAGEHALPVLGLFLAFEWLGGAGVPYPVRLRALAPVLSLTVLYMGLRFLFGYGLDGSAFYISPLSSPLRYVDALRTRIPSLAADLAFGIPSEWHFGKPAMIAGLSQMGFGGLGTRVAHAISWPTLQASLGVFALVLCTLAYFWLRRRARPLAAELRWLLPGALLALLPVCGTMPMSRLTLPAAVGVDALLACLLVWGAERVAQGAVRQRALTLAWLVPVALVHLVHAPMRGRHEARLYAHRSHAEHALANRLKLDDGRVSDQHLLVVAAFDWIGSWGLPYHRALVGQPLPRTTHLLSGAALSPHQLSRVADRVLDLIVLGGHLEDSFAGSCYRPRGAHFKAGDSVDVGVFRASVVRELEGQPIHLRFTFPHSLDDPRYVLLHSTRVGMRRVAMPAVGKQRRLNAQLGRSEL